MLIVGSLKYSPVFKTHCLAFGRACENEGFEVEYIFSKEYEWMLPKDILSRTHLIGSSTTILSMVKDSLNPRIHSKIRGILAKRKASYVYMHNYHFLNHIIAGLTRKLGGKFIYHVHEPYVISKKSHGGFHQFWLHLFEKFQERLLNKTDVAILSSKEAERLFDLRYPNLTVRTLLVPLMYEDLAEEIDHGIQRKYFTFVGPPVPAKGPEKFLQLVEYSKKMNLDYQFLLISRSPIRNTDFQHKNLKIHSKNRISDEEYGNLIKQSIAVMTPYRRETQSSVVLVSY
ncbi:MAG: glycosyltransferase, partial [Candidatus Sifarchaeia archaeon]